MKVLFVCSGNNKDFDIIPFIKDQGESLKSEGVHVDYFPVVGKGLLGYVKAGLRLRKLLAKKHYNLIHAHFTYCGWTALIGAGRKTPVVLSLMGTDANGEYKGNNKVVFKSRISSFLTWLIQPFVSAIISKSSNISESVYRKQKSFIIPNGVDLQKFKPQQNENNGHLIANGKKKVLFLGSRTKVGKNFSLAQAAVQQPGMEYVELISPYPVSHDDIPWYLNEADVLVFPSFMEGSPNVIKEAMACNCPIVATDVGDVRWVLGDTSGCFLASFDPKDFAEKISMALNIAHIKGRTNGRQRIIDLGLDMHTVARRLVDVYKRSISETYEFSSIPNSHVKPVTTEPMAIKN
ncbi:MULTISPECIES: glycosyltransferase family 4 protein [Niastella]|uniref:Glycosyltransferase family 4 protein n=1 Tax=Niastella soli TaxID=2821487 RepID=A0ABS3YRK8_9BACT|nr:glycosyltransferase family 4 protein [Niastella soli]MBO9200510.1 glycosyltransferase family 4 protein [Niastella soli]